MPRPSALYPYFADIAQLKGIGPKTQAKLVKLCGDALIDLLFHLPRDIIDRRRLSERQQDSSVGGLGVGIITLNVLIGSHHPASRRGVPHRISTIIHEGSIPPTELVLSFFHGQTSYWQKTYPTGEHRLISGKLEWRRDQWVMLHPDYCLLPDQEEELPAFEPLYPLTQGLSNRLMRQAVKQTLDSLKPLSEWFRPETLAKHGLPNFLDALSAAHHPQTLADLPQQNPPARQRLALDELLAQ